MPFLRNFDDEKHHFYGWASFTSSANKMDVCNEYIDEELRRREGKPPAVRDPIFPNMAFDCDSRDNLLAMGYLEKGGETIIRLLFVYTVLRKVTRSKLIKTWLSTDLILPQVLSKFDLVFFKNL